MKGGWFAKAAAKDVWHDFLGLSGADQLKKAEQIDEDEGIVHRAMSLFGELDHPKRKGHVQSNNRTEQVIRDFFKL